MFKVNCLTGDPRATVRAKLQVTLEFEVGGANAEDREDSVRELIADHLEDIEDRSWLKGAVKSIRVAEVKETSVKYRVKWRNRDGTDTDLQVFEDADAYREWIMNGIRSCEGAERDHYVRLLDDLDHGQREMYY